MECLQGKENLLYLREIEWDKKLATVEARLHPEYMGELMQILKPGEMVTELFLSTFWLLLPLYGSTIHRSLPHPNGAVPRLSHLFFPSLHLHRRFLSFPPSPKHPYPVLWFPSIPSIMISLVISQPLQISSMLCNAFFCPLE